MNNGQWIPIRYRDFYDVPRIFLTRCGTQSFLFDCKFDEEVEDFPDTYKVYSIPEIPDSELPEDWELLLGKTIELLGEVSLRHVQFDPTRRKFIDAAILDELPQKKPVVR